MFFSSSAAAETDSWRPNMNERRGLLLSMVRITNLSFIHISYGCMYIYVCIYIYIHTAQLLRVPRFCVLLRNGGRSAVHFHRRLLPPIIWTNNLQPLFFSHCYVCIQAYNTAPVGLQHCFFLVVFVLCIGMCGNPKKYLRCSSPL